ncbi:MAG: lactoylglutathione lyase [Epulopiscium sp. Nuni2H_MBin001]|nr:MAG: lactoylglutathione lyase [Epulopiscium sp. Nuni2H_MBin001]
MDYKLYHACIRVLDLDKSIKFYQEALGFEEVRRKDVPENKFTLVFMSDKNRNFEIELTYNYDQETPYDIGNGFSHFAVLVEDVTTAFAHHEELGVTTTKLLDRGKGLPRLYFISDPDGYKTEVVEKIQD